MKPKNIKEFKALVERYETITLEEIKKGGPMSLSSKRKLTGFGWNNTCTLCQAVLQKDNWGNKYKCNDCVYGKQNGCLRYENTNTYYRIVNAGTSRELFSAYRARAKHLKKTYPQYL